MTESSSNIFWFREDDTDMQRAYERARETFRYFWRELAWEARRVVPGLELALVKMPFCDQPDDQNSPVEQMWITDIQFDGKAITGTLANSPHELDCVAEGDEVQLTVPEITDWLYAVAGDRVYGAFTVNVMRSRMPEEERSQHDNAWGLEFGDPLEPKLFPEDWFKSGLSAEIEHPMSENMVPSLTDFLRQDPTHAEVVDENGLNMLHQLALAGSAAGVEVLLKEGVDPNAHTKRGLTARDLAAGLGWPKVVELLDRNSD